MPEPPEFSLFNSVRSALALTVRKLSGIIQEIVRIFIRPPHTVGTSPPMPGDADGEMAMNMSMEAAPTSHQDGELAKRCDAMARTLQWLLDEVVAETMVATEDQPPGLDRVWKAIETNLDASLKRPAIRVLSAALHGHDGARRIKQRCINGLGMAFQIEFNSLGIADASAQARALNAMVMEALRAEAEARHRLPEYRDSLRRHVYALVA
jgi:hypothetical protein